jgi:hypothetical protein
VTTNLPDPQPIPNGDPGTTSNANKPAASQTPQTPDGWSDPWSRPSAWAAFGSDTDGQQPT